MLLEVIKTMTTKAEKCVGSATDKSKVCPYSNMVTMDKSIKEWKTKVVNYADQLRTLFREQLPNKLLEICKNWTSLCVQLFFDEAHNKLNHLVSGTFQTIRKVNADTYLIEPSPDAYEIFQKEASKESDTFIADSSN